MNRHVNAIAALADQLYTLFEREKRAAEVVGIAADTDPDKRPRSFTFPGRARRKRFVRAQAGCNKGGDADTPARVE